MQQSPPDWVSWGTLGVAVVALFQKPLSMLFDSIFRPASIDIRPSASIEVGYSTLGPTIGLWGTLFGFHHDMHVVNMKLRVVRTKDGLTHDFPWIFARSTSATLSGSDSTSQIVSRLPCGFMLRATDPYAYDTLFHDADTLAALRPHLQKYRDAWVRLVLGHVTQAKDGTPPSNPEALYAEFSKDIEVWTKVNDAYYWQPGAYSLKVEVETLKPQKTLSRTWSFELTDSDSSTVRSNCAAILRETCGLKPTYYAFAYAVYKEQALRIGG